MIKELYIEPSFVALNKKDQKIMDLFNKHVTDCLVKKFMIKFNFKKEVYDQVSDYSPIRNEIYTYNNYFLKTNKVIKLK